MVQLLALGEQLLSLHNGGVVAVWRVGEYEAPEVHPCPSYSSTQHPGTHVAAFASNPSISGTKWQHPLRQVALAHQSHTLSQSSDEPFVTDNEADAARLFLECYISE